MVKDGAAVDFAAHLKRNTGRYVGLNKPGDHVHTGALGGQNKVNARRTGFLRQAGNELFNFFAHHHHQVGQFVDHHHNVGQALQGLGAVRREAKGVVQKLATGLGFVNFVVVAAQVAHAQLAHELVATLHFTHAPVQAVGGLLHVGDHGGQQVRNTFVDRHFEHLGVNHQQAHIAGLGLIEQAQNHGVDTHRLARTRGARHQHVGHFG